MRQLPKHECFYKWGPLAQTLSPPHFFFTVSLVLRLPRVTVTTGSIKQHLNPTEAAEELHFFQEVPLIHAIARTVSEYSLQEHGGYCRRQAFTLGELDSAIYNP